MPLGRGKWIPELTVILLMPCNQCKAANHRPSWPRRRSSKQQGMLRADVALLKSLCNILLHGLCSGIESGYISHGALTLPEADLWRSPMAGVVAAGKLFSDRIRH